MAAVRPAASALGAISHVTGLWILIFMARSDKAAAW
jgi:hypothetical protein